MTSASLKTPSTLTELQTAVGAWSAKNFGNQVAKCGPLTGVALLHFAPLLGINEEHGEFLMATGNEPSKDALADIGVYAMDYCTRRGIDWQDVVTSASTYELCDKAEKNPRAAIADGIRTLNHANLKQAQGIRGFDDVSKVVAHEATGLALLFCGLSRYTRDVFNCFYFTDVLTPVAMNVLRRDWLKDPANAAQATDVPVVQDVIPE